MSTRPSRTPAAGTTTTCSPSAAGTPPGYDDIVTFAAGREPELHDPGLLTEWGLQHRDPEHFDVEATRRWVDR